MTAPTTTPTVPQAIGLHDLTLGYDGHPAVHHVSCAFAPGTLTAVIGPNGAGKSTLVKALAGLIHPIGGRIDGLRGQRVAYLPQQAQIDRSFPMTVAELVQLGLWRQRGWFGRFTATDRLAVRHALQQVGLAGFEQRTLAALLLLVLLYHHLQLVQLHLYLLYNHLNFPLHQVMSMFL